MKNEIIYEWTVENIDEDGDIQDSHFADTITDVLLMIDEDYPRNDIGLIRKEGNDADGVQEIYYAYLKDGKLPDVFTDSGGNDVGIKVPSRFINEANASVL